MGTVIGFGSQRYVTVHSFPSFSPDVIAHWTGFFSGLLLGATYGSLANRLRLNTRMQLVFGSLAISLLTYAWLSALRAQLQ